MSDSPEKKRELTMEQRLLLAFVLMFGVMLLTPYFLPKPPEPTPEQKKAAAAKQQQPTSAATNAIRAAQPATSSSAAPVALPEGLTVAQKEDRITIRTDLYEVRFNNRGAVVESWILRQFKQGDGKPLDLVNPLALAHAELHPFTITYKDQHPNVDLRQVLYVAKMQPDGLGVNFEYSQNGVVSKKTFQFTKTNYLTEVTSVVSVNNTAISHLLSWRGGFGDSTVLKAHANQHTTHIAPADNSPTVNDNSKGKNGAMLEGGLWTFAGVEDNYFAALFLPQNGTFMEMQTWSDKLPIAADSKDEELFVGGAVGQGGAQNQFSLYVGPKDLKILSKVNPKLETVVDWGWFFFLAKPLFAFLQWLDGNYIHGWGWSIILTTILINILMIPFKMSSMKNMKKMAAMQPDIAKVNAKYSGVKMTDPKNNDKNAEVMEVYKKYDVNPAGGCVPMFLPIPFLFAFYKVLSLAIDLRGAQWMWVTDLSQPETLAIRILPLLMIGTQFWLQWMTPNTSPDPNQAKMMMLMPLMFGIFFYGASSGLVLYWLTTNILGIAQQMYSNRGVTSPPASAKTIEVKKKGGK